MLKSLSLQCHTIAVFRPNKRFMSLITAKKVQPSLAFQNVAVINEGTERKLIRQLHHHKPQT